MDLSMDARAREVALFAHGRTMRALDRALNAAIEAEEWVRTVARRPDLAEVLSGIGAAIETISGTIKEDWKGMAPSAE